MRVAAEALEETGHLLVHHRVACHATRRNLPSAPWSAARLKQQVAGFEEVAMLGELLDRIAAIAQDASIAIDIGDLGLAAGGRHESRIDSECAGVLP
jgi:hypothetical protein